MGFMAVLREKYVIHFPTKYVSCAKVDTLLSDKMDKASVQ